MILSKNFPFTKLFSRLKQLHVLRFGHRLNPTFPFFILNRFPLKACCWKKSIDHEGETDIMLVFKSFHGLRQWQASEEKG